MKREKGESVVRDYEVPVKLAKCSCEQIMFYLTIAERSSDLIWSPVVRLLPVCPSVDFSKHPSVKVIHSESALTKFKNLLLMNGMANLKQTCYKASTFEGGLTFL